MPKNRTNERGNKVNHLYKCTRAKTKQVCFTRLATLLEGAGYTFKIFECDFQIISFIGGFCVESWKKNYTKACIKCLTSLKLLLLPVFNDENAKNLSLKWAVAGKVL